MFQVPSLSSDLFSAPFALLELRRARSSNSATATATPAGILAAYRLPLPPTDARLDLDPALTITRTQGGVVREHSGPRVRRISFQGEVGLVSRLGTNAQGVTRFLPSRLLFEELHRFLESYLSRAARSPLSSAEPREELELVLRYFDRGLHYVVEPRSFSAIQDPQHRSSFRYELSFETVADADQPAKTPGLFGEVFSLADDAAAASNAVFGCIAQTSALIADLTGQTARMLDTLLVPVRTLVAATELLLQASGDITAIRRLPETAALEVLTAVANLRLAIDGQLAGLTEDERAERSADLAPLLNALDDEQTALQRLVLALRRPQAPLVSNGLTSGYQAHLVRAGDTLEGIAWQRLGDGTRAPEIIELNGLAPPYLSGSGLPGTVRPGGWLVLPADAAAEQGGASPRDPWGSDAALYGIDLQLADGDLVAISRSGADLDDLAVRRGIDNVADALDRRIATTQGSHGLFPGLGLPALVGQESYGLGAWLVACSVEQLQRDPRVLAVESPQLTDGGDRAEVELTVRLAGGQRATLAAAAGGMT